jgi:hypothetical protein
MQGDRHRGIAGAGDSLNTADMIEMGMRHPNLTNLPTALFGLINDTVTIPGWVNDRSFFRFRIGDKVGICLDWSKN